MAKGNATKRGKTVSKKAPPKKRAKKKPVVVARKSPAAKKEEARPMAPVLDCPLDAAEVSVGAVQIGPPRKWTDRDEFIEAVNKWISKRKCRMAWKFERSFGLVKQPDPKPLSIASLCNYLGITTKTFWRWRQDEEHPLWGICQQVMTAIEADLWDSKDPLAKLNLQSNFGHRTKADITTDGKELPKDSALSIDPSKLSTGELRQLLAVMKKAAPD